MNLLSFWTQPNKRYRNFQLLFTFLTINFFFPALTYLFDPATAVLQFEALGRLFGHEYYAYSDQELGFIWRVLASGNVMTLAFMCFLLQIDLRKWYIIRTPLVFLKAYSAFSFGGVYFFSYHFRPFLGVFFYDGITFLGMWFFTKWALQSLDEMPGVTPWGAVVPQTVRATAAA